MFYSFSLFYLFLHLKEGTANLQKVDKPLPEFLCKAIWILYINLKSLAQNTKPLKILEYF